MNVATITMDVEQARAKLKAYHKQLHRKASAEYEAAAKGYEELANGRVLLDLNEVFRDVPRDEKQRPKLAIARSDRREVRYYRASGVDQFDASALQNGSGRDLRVDVLAPIAKEPSDRWNSRGFAIVPLVPADALESAGNPALQGCFTLWEVEQWADRSETARPDRDPFLLKRLAGGLYAVLAEWNLTPLERAIMARARQ